MDLCHPVVGHLLQSVSEITSLFQTLFYFGVNISETILGESKMECDIVGHLTRALNVRMPDVWGLGFRVSDSGFRFLFDCVYMCCHFSTSECLMYSNVSKCV